MKINIVGMAFQKGYDVVEVGMEVVLQAEPTNKYDAKAMLVNDIHGEALGHVANSPKTTAKGCNTATMLHDKGITTGRGKVASINGKCIIVDLFKTNLGDIEIEPNEGFVLGNTSSLRGLRDSIQKAKSDVESYESLFLKAYEKALIADELKHRQVVPSDYYRPSSISACKRNLYFMRTQVVQDDDGRSPTLIGICDSGTDRHERIQNIVAEMDGVITLNIEDKVAEAKAEGINTRFVGWNSSKTEARCCNEDLKIFFQPDGVLKFEGKEVILEIKTMSTHQFNKLYAPKPEHMMQATCYAMGLGIKYILFLYEDRNFTEHKLFLVPVTDVMEQTIIDKVEAVNEALATETIPERECDKCTYCNYKSKCKEIEQLRKEG